MAIDVKVIKVKRSESRHGKPMWILNTAGGDSIYIFDNMLAEMAQAMGAAFPDAHDAAADVSVLLDLSSTFEHIDPCVKATDAKPP